MQSDLFNSFLVAWLMRSMKAAMALMSKEAETITRVKPFVR